MKKLLFIFCIGTLFACKAATVIKPNLTKKEYKEAYQKLSPGLQACADTFKEFSKEKKRIYKNCEGTQAIPGLGLFGARVDHYHNESGYKHIKDFALVTTYLIHPIFKTPVFDLMGADTAVDFNIYIGLDSYHELLKHNSSCSSNNICARVNHCHKKKPLLNLKNIPIIGYLYKHQSRSLRTKY